MLCELDVNSREYQIEKIRWVTANEYTMQYGMTMVEAFVRTVVSYINPEEIFFQIDLDGFKALRDAKPVEDRWLFDAENIEGLEVIFRGRLGLDYPESVLDHMFPSYATCDVLFQRIYNVRQAQSH